MTENQPAQGRPSRIVDMGRQPGVPLDQWADQEAAERERKRRENLSLKDQPAQAVEVEFPEAIRERLALHPHLAPRAVIGQKGERLYRVLGTDGKRRWVAADEMARILDEALPPAPAPGGADEIDRKLSGAIRAFYAKQRPMTAEEHAITNAIMDDLFMDAPRLISQEISDNVVRRLQDALGCLDSAPVDKNSHWAESYRVNTRPRIERAIAEYQTATGEKGGSDE